MPLTYSSVRLVSETEAVELQEFAKCMTGGNRCNTGAQVAWMAREPKTLAGVMSLSISFPADSAGFLVSTSRHVRMGSAAGWQYDPVVRLLGSNTLASACNREGCAVASSSPAFYCSGRNFEDVVSTPRLHDVVMPLVVCVPVWKMPEMTKMGFPCGELTPFAILTATLSVATDFSERTLGGLHMLAYCLAPLLESPPADLVGAIAKLINESAAWKALAGEEDQQAVTVSKPIGPKLCGAAHTAELEAPHRTITSRPRPRQRSTC